MAGSGSDHHGASGSAARAPRAGVDPEEYVGIVELLARYSHLFDRRAWDELDTVFTPSGTWDVTSFGLFAATGLDDLRRLIPTLGHADSHQSSAPVVLARTPAGVEVATSYFATHGDFTMTFGRYLDLVVPTSDGWRISWRRLFGRTRVPPPGAVI